MLTRPNTELEDKLPVMETGCGACLSAPDSIEVDEGCCSTNACSSCTGACGSGGACASQNSPHHTEDESPLLESVLQSLGGRGSQRGKVLVAMSGGVDSSVLCAIIAGLGYEGIGVHMRFWADESVDDTDGKFPENKCCSLESLEHARQVATKYGMPFYVLNTKDEFKEKIVDYFVRGFEDGVTPNPCIECNRSIKFGYLYDKMLELDADYIATGHYVKVEKEGETYFLKMADDRFKDQSYFLYTLNQEKLSHCLFPLAGLNKTQVRTIARQEGLLNVADKRDSQGICFFPEKSYVPFLERYMDQSKNQAGDIVNVKGDVLGAHKGLAYYTIGQRQGLEIGGPGGPYYVIGKDAVKNHLIVGGNDDLFSDLITVKRLSFVGDVPRARTKILARIRHRFTPNDAYLEVSGDTAIVKFIEPQRAITPGQSIVFYDRDCVLGGGIIV